MLTPQELQSNIYFMSKIDCITAQISFQSNDSSLIETLTKNPLMYDSVWKHAKDFINAHTKVHVNQREPDDGPIEWFVSVTSPTGRKTFTFSQRSSLGSVSIQPG